MKLTKAELATIICALNDAISDRVSFHQCHLDHNGQVMEGYQRLVNRTLKTIRDYEALVLKIRAEYDTRKRKK